MKISYNTEKVHKLYSVDQLAVGTLFRKSGGIPPDSLEGIAFIKTNSGDGNAVDLETGMVHTFGCTNHVVILSGELNCRDA